MESPILNSMRWLLNEQYRKVRKLEEENRRLSEKNKIYSNALVKEKEDKDKLKELLNITVQTKNEYIRNLLEELEYYKKQCGED